MSCGHVLFASTLQPPYYPGAEMTTPARSTAAVFLMCALSWMISAVLVYRKISGLKTPGEERVSQRANVVPLPDAATA
jgi:hypothetical protein